jgi:hypothetical protein
MAVAAMIPMLAGSAKKGTETAVVALKNDIATLKGTTKPRGKGKKKKGGGLEYEIHVNPVSIATGAAVVGGVALGGMWLSGIGLQRDTGTAKTVTVRNTGTAEKPIWAVYSAKGIKYKTLGPAFMPSDVLMDGQMGRGWEIAKDGIVKNNDFLYTIVLVNKTKKSFGMTKRPRYSIFGSDTSGGGITVYDVLVSPYWWTRYL